MRNRDLGQGLRVGLLSELLSDVQCVTISNHIPQKLCHEVAIERLGVKLEHKKPRPCKFSSSASFLLKYTSSFKLSLLLVDI